VLLASARQGLDQKRGRYLGSKRKVKRYSDKLTSDKIIFLTYRLTFYQDTEKACGRRLSLSIFFKFHGRRHPSRDSTRESVALLLQVLWVSVSINFGQNWQQHRNGEDPDCDADHYSNKEETKCFLRFGHMVLEQISLMKFKF
jgi:hypothetical protein